MNRLVSFITLSALFLAACTPVASGVTPTATFLSPTSTIEPSATPDVFQPVINALQAEGINVVHLDGNADKGWGLVVNGVDVPDAYFDENGAFLVVQAGDEEIKIPAGEAAERLELNEDGILVLDDAEGNAIAAFDPINHPEKWMYFPWAIVGPEAPLDFASELSLNIEVGPDGKPIVILPEELLLFERVSAQPFSPEAHFLHYRYEEGDWDAGFKQSFFFDLSPAFPEDVSLWQERFFANNPNSRPAVLFNKMRLSEESATGLGLPGEELYIYIYKFMNDPENDASNSKPYGFVHYVVVGEIAGKLEEKGYFSGGGVLLAAVSSPVEFGENYWGRYRTLVDNLYNLQRLRKKDAAAILEAVAEEDVILEEMEDILWLCGDDNSILGIPFSLKR